MMKKIFLRFLVVFLLINGEFCMASATRTEVVDVEINKISDLDNVLLYYKNINILEYCYTQIFFKENFNKKLCSYYKTELNFNFNEKLNLIVKILYIKNNILISNKVYIIFKSIHYRLNKI